MPIPDYQTLMLPVLKLFRDGATNVSECLPAIRKEFSITDEEAQELIPSGTVTLLSNRTHWARTYLSKAGLLYSPERNLHVITDTGRALLKSNPGHIDNSVLASFEEFSEWKSKPADDTGTEDETLSAAATSPKVSENTPEEAIASAALTLNSALTDELLQILQSISWVRFERLILDLLNALGYGGGKLSVTSLTKAGADGGIDGVINEDPLGLDAVYIQAKRYAPDKKVGRPDIQKFVGSLTGESATKGVFVTTSDFSKDAHDYINRVQHRIVLINGSQLAKLMIAHGVGVRVRTTYLVRSIDEDYFADLEG